MIAFANRPARDLNDRFIDWLPQIRRRAQFAFRFYPAEARAELVQAVIANAYVAFQRLATAGKIERAYASPLIKFAVRQVSSGRRVGERCRQRDVMSPANRRVKVRRLERFDTAAGEWRETLVEDHRSGPAEIAAMRIDVSAWLETLSPRDRKLARLLSRGESTAQAAARFQVSAARISQLRGKLERSWQAFQGEPVLV